MLEVVEASEPIIAYRWWRIGFEKNLIGSGYGSWVPGAWAPGVRAEAACLGLECPAHDEFVAPVARGNCGFWGVKTPNDMPCHTTSFCGRVALWGTVYEHKWLYRAQYAYPRVFYYVPEADSLRFCQCQRRMSLETLTPLALRYGVPVEPMPFTLLGQRPCHPGVGA